MDEVDCPNGHANPVGNDFCARCGVTIPHRVVADGRPTEASTPIQSSVVEGRDRNRDPSVPPAPLIPAEGPKHRSRTVLVVVLVGVVALVAVGLYLHGHSQSEIERVAAICHLPTQDNGTTLSVNIDTGTTTTDPTTGIATGVSGGDPKSLLAVACVSRNLPVPSYVQSGLGNASGNSGPITMTWDKFTGTETYNGIDGTGTFTIHQK